MRHLPLNTMPARQPARHRGKPIMASSWFHRAYGPSCNGEAVLLHAKTAMNPVCQIIGVANHL